MSPNGSRAALAACAAVLACGCLLHARFGYANALKAGSAWGADDAYITFRFAEHLARGDGPVFNPGERVEGYSAPLYVLLMAPILAAGREAAYPGSLALGVLCSSLALAALFRRARGELGARAALGCAAAFALCPAVWLWASSGLETPLVMLLQVALWAALPGPGREGRPRAAAALAAAAVVARADGFVVAGAAVVYLLAAGRRRDALRAAAAAGAALAVLTAWRLAYYGDPLPNTYYAKVAGSLPERAAPAAVLLPLALAVCGLLPHAAALVAAGARAAAGLVARRTLPAGLGFEAVLAPALLLYWVAIGGDYYRERFLVVLAPLGVVAIVRATGGRPLAAAALAAAQLVPFLADGRFEYRADKYDMYVTVGRFLGARYPGALIAVDAAGKVPFFSGLRAVDMLGLTDPHVARVRAAFTVPAHSKFDADYVLGRRPNLIAAATAPGASGDLAWGLDRARYERAGYALRYLANRTPESKAENVVDVAGLDGGAVARLIDEGYAYGILERTGP